MDKRIVDSIDCAQKILIGIGESFETEDPRVDEAYKVLSGILKDKDYYIISTCTDDRILQAGLDESRVVRPLVDDEDSWNKYNEWLSRTLNRELCIVELGVGLKCPGVIRWPFEKVVMVNKKATMYRVHRSLYQTTDEMGDKCVSVKGDPINIIIED